MMICKISLVFHCYYLEFIFHQKKKEKKRNNNNNKIK